jgi:hypothetical protein
MKQYEAAGIGIVMGCLYGLVLWATVDALSMASFILYKDTRVLPEVTTAIVMILGFFCLFTYPYWAGKLEQMIVYTVTKQEEDDDE